MNVELPSGVDQRAIQITMLHGIATAATEVTGATIFSTRFAHVLGDFSQIWGLDNFAASFG